MTKLYTLGAVFVALSFAVPATASVKIGDGYIKGGVEAQIDRRKKRIPGGSGCDDPRDLIEHPECRR